MLGERLLRAKRHERRAESAPPLRPPRRWRNLRRAFAPRGRRSSAAAARVMALITAFYGVRSGLVSLSALGRPRILPMKAR